MSELKDKKRLWTLQLIQEYQHICYSFRLKLKKPVIAVESLSGKWGCYDNETRTLTISERLIENYPWTVVLEVFKHEICHQIVFETHKSEEIHGPLFRQTAKQLGLSAWAMRAESEIESPLADLIDSKMSPEEERLSGRVEKLLSLATSANEHEATAAMQKVQELYAKYNFDKVQNASTNKMNYIVVNLKRKRVERYQSSIASLLSDHFFVDIIHTTIYDSVDCEDYKALEILGSRENVQMAEYVFHFLENQLKLLWKEYSSEVNKGRRAKTSFYLGVISGFREKLEKSTKKINTEYEKAGVSLVALKDGELKNYVSERYPRLKRVYHGRRYHDSDSYSVGKDKGKNLNLHKAVHKSGIAGLLFKRH